MPLTSDTLKGMWAGMPVPWTAQDQVDEEALRENVRRMCRAGAHGVYTHGTTGEFYAQTPEEWRQVARVTVEECGRSEPPPRSDAPPSGRPKSFAGSASLRRSEPAGYRSPSPSGWLCPTPRPPHF